MVHSATVFGPVSILRCPPLCLIVPCLTIKEFRPGRRCQKTIFYFHSHLPSKTLLPLHCVGTGSLRHMHPLCKHPHPPHCSVPTVCTSSVTQLFCLRVLRKRLGLCIPVTIKQPGHSRTYITRISSNFCLFLDKNANVCQLLLFWSISFCVLSFIALKCAIERNLDRTEH